MDNFSIKFHKGAKKPFFKEKESDFFDGKSPETDFRNGYSEFDEQLIKSLWFRQLLHAQTLCDSFPKRVVAQVDYRAIDEVARGKVELFEEYQGLNYYRVNWRLAIGIGNTSIFENSITLHHVYGIPYIPGSAVKGILRSWLIQEYFSYDVNGEKYPVSGESRALSDENFCYIFGTPAEFTEKEDNQIEKRTQSVLKDREGNSTAHVGNIVFFDAYPVTKPKITWDIINPHYPDYYRDGDNVIPPADWQNPIPIFFLTVKDTDFQILFGLKKGCHSAEREKLRDIEFTHPSNPTLNKRGTAESVLNQLLDEALGNGGIGAKTSVGYGRMKNLSSERRERLQQEKLEIEKQEAIKRAQEEKNRIQEEKKIQEARDLEERRERNKASAAIKKQQYVADGIESKIRNLSDFEAVKKVISDYKKVVGKIDSSDHEAIKSAILKFYQSATRSDLKRWEREGKGEWGIIRSWVSAEIANKWFKDIVSKL